MRGIDDEEVGGRAVLLRADLNVPLDGTRITDDGRIRASLPTIPGWPGGAPGSSCSPTWAGRQGAGFAGRAAGGPSLEPVAGHLGRLLGRPVRVRRRRGRAVRRGGRRRASATVTSRCWRTCASSRPRPARTNRSGPRWPAGSPRWAPGPWAMPRRASRCTSATGSARCTASTPACTTCRWLLPHAAGDLVLAEVEVLRKLTTGPQRPYVVVLGGAKPSDKLGVIGNLLGQADRLLIGGGMSYTFLAAQGHEVGKSLLEASQIPHVTSLMEEASRRGVEIVLPADIVAATHFAADADHDVVPATAFPADREGMDIGPATRALFAQKLADARTVFWNGPMGVFEFPAFAAGTLAVAKAISGVSGLTVVGGGDSAAAVRQLGLGEDAFGHISTGGGASLEYLEGRTLPGLTALGDDR